jgi:hypothetical protein
VVSCIHKPPSLAFHLPILSAAQPDHLPPLGMARNRGNDDSSSDAGSNDHDPRKEKNPKSRKPPNTAFRQQRLLAYAPILTPKTVLPLFFAVGIIFGPIGGLLLYASSKVNPIHLL